MSLRNYEQDKFAIAEILRSTSNLAPSEDRALRERLRDLFVRLAEDRFNLVVVGRFNRGKNIDNELNHGKQPLAGKTLAIDQFSVKMRSDSTPEGHAHDVAIARLANRPHT